jgi:FkbM family methyltransferase
MAGSDFGRVFVRPFGNFDLMSFERSWQEKLANFLGKKGFLKTAPSSRQHPVFDSFAFAKPSDDGVDTDYLGLRTLNDMLPPHWVYRPVTGSVPYPAVDEEYFEWIDVLESVAAATDRFTILELGAGYARWSARGCVAAKQRGLKFNAVVVECEPQHALWAREHFAFNGLPPDCMDLVEVALGQEFGETVFLVEMPEGRDGNNAREWYGQAVTWATLDQAEKTARDYHGHPLVEMPGGWMGIKVPVKTLSSVLAPLDRVDLADFDVQGVEAKIIREAIGPLTDKVVRLHIGTHSREIDAELPRILGPAGWRCIQSYPCLRWNRTPFGWVEFNDGIQTWINPRLT